MPDHVAPVPHEKKSKRTKTERLCPKCGGAEAYGPQYRSADAKFPVERMRFDCCTCGFITCDPVMGATDDEKRVVAETQAKLQARWSGGEGYVQERQPMDNRSCEIAEIVYGETRRHRRNY